MDGLDGCVFPLLAGGQFATDKQHYGVMWEGYLKTQSDT